MKAPRGFEPIFLERGTGGSFRRKDPNVKLETLESHWVEDASDLYIGMAKDSLRKRVWLLLRFGHGKAVAHWGGRLLWQIENSDDLLLDWYGHDVPAEEEGRLLREFKGRYGQLPFANLKE